MLLWPEEIEGAGVAAGLTYHQSGRHKPVVRARLSTHRGRKDGEFQANLNCSLRDLVSMKQYGSILDSISGSLREAGCWQQHWHSEARMRDIDNNAEGSYTCVAVLCACLAGWGSGWGVRSHPQIRVPATPPLQGTPADVLYKGTISRIVGEDSPSRLDRAREDTLPKGHVIYEGKKGHVLSYEGEDRGQTTTRLWQLGGVAMPVSPFLSVHRMSFLKTDIARPLRATTLLG